MVVTPPGRPHQQARARTATELGEGEIRVNAQRDP